MGDSERAVGAQAETVTPVKRIGSAPMWVLLTLALAELAAQTAPGAGPGVIGPGIHADEIEGVAFSSDGHLLATADNGGRIEIWDARTRQPLRALAGRNFTEVAFFPGSNLIAASGFDRTVRVW